MIGKSFDLKASFSKINMVVEGVKTCKTAYYLSRSKNIETPIIDAVYDVLFNQIEPEIVLKKIND